MTAIVRVDDRSARALVTRALSEAAPGREQTLAALQCVQAVARLESHYGQGWKGDMKGSWNFGAMQSTAKPLPDGSAPPGTAWAVDTHPTSTGASVPYRQLFRTYPGPYEGCLDLVKWFARRPDVLDAADAGDVVAFSAAMRKHRYYEGFGPTEEARILNHAKTVMKNAAIIAEAMGEKLALSLDGPAWLGHIG